MKTKLYKYQVNWSPYSTAIRATSKADAIKLIRKSWGRRDDFFRLLD